MLLSLSVGDKVKIGNRIYVVTGSGIDDMGRGLENAGIPSFELTIHSVRDEPNEITGGAGTNVLPLSFEGTVKAMPEYNLDQLLQVLGVKK